MRTAIVNYLKKVSELPEGKFPPEYYTPRIVRTYIFGTLGYPLGGAAHALFLIGFALLGIKWLAIFNIFSVTIYTTSFFLHRKGYFGPAFTIMMIEVLAHAAACGIILGWAVGFQLILVPFPVFVFLTHWSVPRKALISLVSCGSFALMHFCIRPLTPIVDLSPLYVYIFYYGNFIIVSLTIAAFGFSFYSAAINVDEKLEMEKERTNAALNDRSKALKHLNDELSEAADYVKRILPSPILQGTIRTNWRFIPSTSLGGDAFGYHKVDREHFGIYLIDVSGHGVGAALLSISAINVLRSQSLPSTDFKDPGQVLRSLNLAFPSESNKDMFFTMWYGVYNQVSRELAYASGGHPPAILFNGNSSNGSKAKLLRTPNNVVGGMSESTYKTERCSVGDGSTLYVFSDGVYEVEKPDGSMWRYQEFTDYMLKIRTDGHEVLDRLYSYVRELGNSETLEDDFTILEVAFA